MLYHELITIGLFQLMLVLRTGAAAVTLYDVAVNPEPTVTPTRVNGLKIYGTTKYSAINPGQTDVTKYAVQEVRSQVLIHDLTATYTVLSVPTTLDYTVEQGASVYRASVPSRLNTELPSGFNINWGSNWKDCTFDVEKKQGVCQYVVEKYLPVTLNGPSSSQTTTTAMRLETYTYSGPLLPIATVTTPNAAPDSNVSKYVAVWPVLSAISLLLFSWA